MGLFVSSPSASPSPTASASPTPSSNPTPSSSASSEDPGKAKVLKKIKDLKWEERTTAEEYYSADRLGAQMFPFPKFTNTVSNIDIFKTIFILIIGLFSY